MKRTIRLRNAGFTLLEIMLVVMIIALLAGAAIYGLSGNLDTARIIRTEGDIKTIGTQLMVYEARNGSFPSAQQGLKALVVRPDTEPRPRNWSQYMPEVPRDGWGQEFNYVAPGIRNPQSYDLFSSGPDKIPNTPDDIGNWSK